MSFKDIFKKSFLEGYSGTDITTKTIVVALFMACILAIYIFFVYRSVTRKTFYSKNFNISLVCITVITAGIILTIQSSVVVSLGMVGALSIVRFRTAIKDPLDLMFIFWGISVGIICGAGLSEIAIILSILVTIAVVVLDLCPVAKVPMILVINSTDIESEEKVIAIVSKYAKHYNVKSRNMTVSSLDMIVEVRTSQGSELLQEIMKTEGVTSASLLSHDGEVTF